MRKFAAKNFHKPCNLVTLLSTFNSRSLKSLEQRRVNSSRPTALALLPPWCLHRVVAVQCDQRLKLKVAKKIKSCPKKSKVAQKVTIIASLKSVISQYSPKGHHKFGPLYHQDVFKKRPIWSHCRSRRRRRRSDVFILREFVEENLNKTKRIEKEEREKKRDRRQKELLIVLKLPPSTSTF